MAATSTEVSVENILAQISQLAPAEQQQIIEALTGRPFQPPREWFRGRIISTKQPYNPRTKEYAWLAQHRYEYIGEWLALKDDRLLAHGPEAKKVFAQARESGVADPYFVYVNDPDVPQM
jgi:hypothetical protein